MNSKIAILAASLGLALASSLHAQTPNFVRIIGTDTLRETVQNQIKALMPDATIAYSNPDISYASLNIAKMANFSGTFLGRPTIVQVSWTPSSYYGFDVVSQSFPIPFLSTSYVGTTGDGTKVDDSPSSLQTNTAKPDATISDVFQNSTPFHTPRLVDFYLCVVPYVWAVNDGAPANFTNMTSGLAQNLYGAQYMSLSLFTASPADRIGGALVYGLGRTPDAGSRMVMTTDAGLGALATVFQSIVSQSGDFISNPQPFPAGNTLWGDGNNGYASSGYLASPLMCKSSDSNVYLGYLTARDFSILAYQGGARSLSWEGVAYSPATVQEGEYSLWGYAHLCYQSSISSSGSPLYTFLTALKNNVQLNPGPVGIKLSDMHVSRFGDGAPIGN